MKFVTIAKKTSWHLPWSACWWLSSTTTRTWKILFVCTSFVLCSIWWTKARSKRPKLKSCKWWAWVKTQRSFLKPTVSRTKLQVLLMLKKKDWSSRDRSSLTSSTVKPTLGISSCGSFVSSCKAKSSQQEPWARLSGACMFLILSDLLQLLNSSNGSCNSTRNAFSNSFYRCLQRMNPSSILLHRKVLLKCIEIRLLVLKSVVHTTKF